MIKTEKAIETPGNDGNNISVLGLGAMGTAIAGSFLNNGYHTTVWNRSADGYAPLVAAGATATTTAAEAVAASLIVVICLPDNAAVDEVLQPLKNAVGNKVIVNLTSSSPAQARAFAHWAEAQDAAYINGKILADPQDVGMPKGLLFFSGKSGIFVKNQKILEVLGTITYLGEDPGSASVDFLSQITIGYEILLGFLNTLKLVQAEGIDWVPLLTLAKTLLQRQAVK